MTLTMTLENLIKLAQEDLYTEYYPGAPINNGAMVEFILDQFKQNLEQKGITLKVI